MEQTDLFLTPERKLDPFGVGPGAPLAWRMRPQNLDQYFGQKDLLAPGTILRRAIEADNLSSLIFFGPPGSGKTTLAFLISTQTKALFRSLNAVTSNIQELKKCLSEAESLRLGSGRRTILFIDEIHRFNKAQQDVLMPEVERGSVILIGATTQNPFFSINSALISRSLVCELKPLSAQDIRDVLNAALRDEVRGLGKKKVALDELAMEHLIVQASGDARRALNALDLAVLSAQPSAEGKIIVTLNDAEQSSQTKMVRYDRQDDEHYDTISAFIKSIRGSDPDAAIYWLAKMLYGGEEVRFITRRLVVLAAEDVGCADPHALMLAQAAAQACEFIGMPEARIILSEAVLYLSLAPKSNSAIRAIDQATADIQSGVILEVPQHLRDGHYAGAKKLGRGQGYRYAHDGKDHYVDQAYLPEERKYFHPGPFGFEQKMSERLRVIKENCS